MESILCLNLHECISQEFHLAFDYFHRLELNEALHHQVNQRVQHLNELELFGKQLFRKILFNFNQLRHIWTYMSSNRLVSV